MVALASQRQQIAQIPQRGYIGILNNEILPSHADLSVITLDSRHGHLNI